MRVQIHLKRSAQSIITISFLSALPLTTGLVVPLSGMSFFLVLLLTPLLWWLFYNNIISDVIDDESHLSWNDGIWTFRNAQTICQGMQSKVSFSLGLVVFLSIEDENDQKIELWLFPDSLFDSKSAWRHLLCCLYLSAKR